MKSNDGKIFTDVVYKKFSTLLDQMKINLDKLSDEDISMLEKLSAKMNTVLGVSEHTQWRVRWDIYKWNKKADKDAGLPYNELVCDTQNLVLDTGANEILKLISGQGGTAFSNDNAKLYVGSSDVAENAAQTGIQATTESAYAAMDTGYPMINGRQIVFRGTFEEDAANFEWKELAVANGVGSGAISLNRKVADMGRKATGVWVLQVTISVTNPPKETV